MSVVPRTPGTVALPTPNTEQRPTRIGFPHWWRRARFFNLPIVIVDFEDEERQENGRPTGDLSFIKLPLEIAQMVFNGHFKTIELFQLRSISSGFKQAIENVLKQKQSLGIRLAQYHVKRAGLELDAVNRNYGRNDEKKQISIALSFVVDQLEYLRTGGWEENFPVDVDIDSDRFNRSVFEGLALLEGVETLTLRIECKFDRIQVVRRILCNFPKLKSLTIFFVQYERTVHYPQHKPSENGFTPNHMCEMYQIIDESSLPQLTRLEMHQDYCNSRRPFGRGQPLHRPRSVQLRNLTHFMMNMSVNNQQEVWRTMLASGSLTHLTLNLHNRKKTFGGVFSRANDPVGASVTYLHLANLNKYFHVAMELSRLRHHFPNVQCLVVQYGQALFNEDYMLTETSHKFRTACWFIQLNRWTHLTELKLYNCIPCHKFRETDHDERIALPSLKKLTILAYECNEHEQQTLPLFKRELKFESDDEFKEYDTLEQVLIDKYAKVRLMARFPQVEQLLLVDYHFSPPAYLLYSNETFKLIRGFVLDPSFRRLYTPFTNRHF